jgi:hypothetical protein
VSRLAVILVATLLPAAAWACPACATRSSAGPGTALLIASLVAAPYAVAVVALKVIRRLDKDPR